MSRRGENIYKRKDGRWEARYIKQYAPSGKAIYGYVYARSYHDVREKLQQYKQERNFAAACGQKLKSNARKENSATIREVAERWLHVIAPRIKESTRNKYQNLLDSYVYPKLGDQCLHWITNALLERHCNELLTVGGVSGNGLAPKTVSDILSVIRSVLKFAAKEGETVFCDGKGICIKQTMNKMRVFSRFEQEQLCRYLYGDLNEYNMGILVCLFTGLRLGEICALQWEDISIAEQVIHVHQTLQRIQDKSGTSKTKLILSSPKSACSMRSIPIPDELLKVIRTRPSNANGFFLTSSALQYIDPRTMQNRFKQVLEICHIKEANFHALRHTFATRCIELGFDVKSLSEILGHASVNITMNRYVHPSMELKKENMNRLSELFAVK